MAAAVTVVLIKEMLPMGLGQADVAFWPDGADVVFTDTASWSAR